MATFGQILSSIVLAGGKSVRRNVGDSAFEAYDTPSFNLAFTAGGNAQGNAAISADVTIITTAAGAPSGVTLPLASPSPGGRQLLVFNDNSSDNQVNIYPQSGGQIDLLGANVPMLVNAQDYVRFFATSSLQWWSSRYLNVSAATLNPGRNIDGQFFNGSANITVVAPATHVATSKSTPVDADELPLINSSSGYALWKVTWANLKATLKNYYDGFYLAISAVGSMAYQNSGSVGITGGTVAGAAVSGGTVAGAAVSGGTVANTAISGSTIVSTKISPRKRSRGSAGSVTPDVDSYDLEIFLNLFAATLTVNAHNGTAVDGTRLTFRITDNGTSRSISWNAEYVGGFGLTLPGATTASKRLEVEFEWDETLVKMVLIRLGEEV